MRALSAAAAARTRYLIVPLIAIVGASFASTGWALEPLSRVQALPERHSGDVDILAQTYNVWGVGNPDEGENDKDGESASLAVRLQHAVVGLRTNSEANFGGQMGVIGLQEAGDKVPNCFSATRTVADCLSFWLKESYPGSEPQYQQRGGLGILWDNLTWENVGYEPHNLTVGPLFRNYLPLGAWRLARRMRSEAGTRWEDHDLVAVRLRHRQRGWTVRFFNTHLAPGGYDKCRSGWQGALCRNKNALTRRTRKAQVRQVADILGRHVFMPGELPPILVGDLNFDPQQERDNDHELSRRLELANRLGPDGSAMNDRVIQVWMGRASRFTRTRGAYRLEHYSLPEMLVPREISGVTDRRVTDHIVPALGFKAQPNEGRVTWEFDGNLDGISDKTVQLGQLGDLPVAGDWNRDGKDGIAVFRPHTGQWFLDNDADGLAERTVSLGGQGDLPIAGDWNRDGQDGIAVFRPTTGQWFLDDNADGVANRTIGRFMGWTVGQLNERFRPEQADLPLAGDWDRDGRDGIAIFRPRTGRWYFDTNLDRVAERQLRSGRSNDLPVAGDWNGDRRDGIALFRLGQWRLDDNGNGLAERAFTYGVASDMAVTGDWDGDRVTGVAIVR